MAQTFDCTRALKNIAQQGCDFNPGQDYSFIFVPITQEFATEADALTEANWTTLINASSATRARIMANIDDPTPEDEEKPIFETNNKNRYGVRKGFRRTSAKKHMPSPAYVEAVKSLGDGVVYGMYIVSENGFIIGKSIDGIKFQPMPVKVFTDDLTQQPDADTPASIMLRVDFDDPNTIRSFTVNPLNEDTPWDAKTLDGIDDIYFTLVSGAADEIIVEAWTRNGKAPVEGMVVTDFLDAEGELASITDVGNKYTLIPTTTFTTGYVVILKDQPDTTTKGVESPIGLTVTF